MDGDDIVFKAESPVIYASSAVIARNNIVANTSRPMIGFSQPDFEVGSTVEYNLCDNPVADLCGGDNIVDGDPLFTDTVNYVPAAGSAAIDAGDPLGIFNDVDGSRNNLGAYGGTFAVDQYDVQRAGGRVEPYLYPLFEPNKSVSSTGKLNVRVIGLARSK